MRESILCTAFEVQNQNTGKPAAPAIACGRVRGYVAAEDEASPQQWQQVTPWRSNLVVYQWADIVAKLLANGDSRYRIAGMYLEFANVASPGDTVSPPSYARTRTIDYYNSLATNPDVDYLRVPLIATQLSASDGNFANNLLSFFAKSSGLTGVHGKSFSAGSNSVVYGASLVAYVAATDATQDLLFSSIYLDPADQQPKLATSQVGIEWQLALG